MISERDGGLQSRSVVESTSGFTLIELVVVLAVMGILVGTAVPLASAVIDADRQSEARAEVETIADALHSYWYDRTVFPATLVDPTFLGVYLQPGVANTTVVEPWGTGVGYVYTKDDATGLAMVHSRGRDGVDDGFANEEVAVTVHAAVPGLEKTRTRMRLITEVLAGYLEGGGTLTGTWATDRAALGLGIEYEVDGFGTAFTLDPASLVLRSAGPDRVAGTADDVTT